MKSLSLMASIVILLCNVSCKKVLTPLPVKSGTASPSGVSTDLIENLGAPIKGSSVLWKINPMFENMEPLFTYAANSNSGYVALMIDNGNKAGLPFKFLAVDLISNTSKSVYIKDKNGANVTASVGRISRYMFGMNKKFYVATENGGHLIEYDPNTQTATDLGQPFNIDGRVLDIYSLSVGTDGALYGGSFGSDGDVYSFRYDYNSFYVDKTSIDDDSKYVAYVSGDDRYTYAAVGQNSWKLYAIDRSTGTKQLMLQSVNPADRISLASYSNGCYGTFLGKTYRLSGSYAKLYGAGDDVIGARIEYLPYQPSNPTLPKIVWNECDKNLYYKFPAGIEKSIQLSDVVDETYGVSSMTAMGNKLFLTGGKMPRMVMYDKQYGFTCLGTPSINVYLMTIVPGSNGTKMVMGGYPKGAMLEYNATNAWTMGTGTISTTAPDVSSPQSNPRKIEQLQDQDNNGVYGPMTVCSILYTKDGTMVAGGNNDRLTETGSRQVAIGTIKNGIKRNFAIPEFNNYEFRSMCLSGDSTEVLISAVAKYGGNGKIFRYKPTTNSITSIIDIPTTSDAGIIQLFEKNLVIGSYDDVMYLLDVSTQTIVYKKVFGSGQRIHAFTVAPDHSIWIDHAYLNVFISRMIKMNFNTVDLKAVTATTTEITILKNPDNDEGAQPSGLLFMKTASGSYDLYISGFRSLLRMNSALTPSFS